MVFVSVFDEVYGADVVHPGGLDGYVEGAGCFGEGAAVDEDFDGYLLLGQGQGLQDGVEGQLDDYGVFHVGGLGDVFSAAIAAVIVIAAGAQCGLVLPDAQLPAEYVVHAGVDLGSGVAGKGRSPGSVVFHDCLVKADAGFAVGIVIEAFEVRLRGGFAEQSLILLYEYCRCRLIALLGFLQPYCFCALMFRALVVQCSQIAILSAALAAFAKKRGYTPGISPA